MTQIFVIRLSTVTDEASTSERERAPVAGDGWCDAQKRSANNRLTSSRLSDIEGLKQLLLTLCTLLCGVFAVSMSSGPWTYACAIASIMAPQFRLISCCLDIMQHLLLDPSTSRSPTIHSGFLYQRYFKAMYTYTSLLLPWF